MDRVSEHFRFTTNVLGCRMENGLGGGGTRGSLGRRPTRLPDIWWGGGGDGPPGRAVAAEVLILKKPS